MRIPALQHRWMGILLVGTAFSAPAFAQSAFTENVTFRFAANNITYQGPINSAWLMLDVEGGRNKVAAARQMSCDNHAELIGPW